MDCDCNAYNPQMGQEFQKHGFALKPSLPKAAKDERQQNSVCVSKPEPMASNILIVDDDETQRQLLASLAERLGYQVECASSGEQVLARLSSPDAPHYDAALIDLVMPDLDGMAVIARLRKSGLTLPVLALVTPQGLDAVMSAIRAGAQDFLVKPVAPERLAVSLANVMKLQALGEDPARVLERTEPESENASGPVLLDATMSVQCEKHAKSDMPLLIEGEPGTGKGVLARVIHRASSRRKKPCVMLSAQGSKAGYQDLLPDALRKAKTGTLIIRDIDSLSLDDQSTLLSTLKPMETPSPVRLIATSSADLLALIRIGRFREDLFYLITTGTLRVAPLRNRREEMHRLARQIMLKEAHLQGKNLHSLDPEALKLLENRDWPGNIPELQSVIRRAIRYAESNVLASSEIEMAEADRDMRALLEPAIGRRGGQLQESDVRSAVISLFDKEGRLRPFAEIEAEILREALAHCHGRVAMMARHLGIGRSTIYRKLKDLGLDSEPEADSMIGEAA